VIECRTLSRSWRRTTLCSHAGILILMPNKSHRNVQRIIICRLSCMHGGLRLWHEMICKTNLFYCVTHPTRYSSISRVYPCVHEQERKYVVCYVIFNMMFTRLYALFLSFLILRLSLITQGIISRLRKLIHILSLLIQHISAYCILLIHFVILMF